VRYFDERPIAPCDPTQILNGLQSDDYAVVANHRGPGIFLAHADWQLNELRRRPPQGPLIESITFDGRLDNRDDLLLQLKDRLTGDTSDAALTLAAYKRWGAAGLVRLIGDWSLVIWDSGQETIVLASDFAGVRPLYYCLEPARLSWSTRLAALAGYTQISELDDEYVASLLGFGEGTNRTPYKGIYSVPPGHFVRVTNGAATIERFWTLPIGNTIRYQRQSAYEEHLRALFSDAVRCRLPNHSTVISELSGGLDSSSIVCMARHLSESLQGPRLVTMSLEHPDSIDTRFYTLVENFCKTEAIHLSTSEHAFLAETPAASAAPTGWQDMQMHMAGIARQLGATVYLTGQLGDFIMGNRWDDSHQISGLLRRGRFSSALKASLAWSKVLRIPVYWVLYRALVSSLPSRIAPIHAYESADGPYSPRNTEDSIAPEFRERVLLNGQSRSDHNWRNAAPERRKHFRELSLILQSRKLQPPEPLEHLEYTHPYAHRPLVEYMMSIPADLLCGPGEPRRLMRLAFHDLWPPELRKRCSKDSFGGVLLDSLRPVAQRLAQKPSRLLVVERGYVEAKSLEQRLNRLALALECNEPQLRQIILLELWLRRRTQRVASDGLSLSA